MNDLISRQLDPAPKWRSGLPNLEQYLDADRSVRAMALAVRVPNVPHEPEFWPGMSRAFAVQDAQCYRAELADALSQAAPVDMIDRHVAAMREIVNAGPNRRVTMAALALLVDSKVRRPANPEVYIRTAEHDLLELGFPPVVVVVALQRLRREMVFLPEIAELIAACRVEADRLRETLNLAIDAGRRRAAFERAQARVPALLAEAEATKPLVRP